MSTSTSETVAADVEIWLANHLPEAVPPFELTRITGGYSMLTYRMIDQAGHAWALRLPPKGSHSGGAHDPSREARAMLALRDTAVPVPRVRIVGTDADPLGTPCHITDFVDGFVISSEDEAREHLSASALTKASQGIVSTLAQMHQVDIDAVGLGDLGPREDYIGRQLRRWRRALDEMFSVHPFSQVQPLRDIADDLENSLTGGRRVSLIHGDYRLGNAITRADGTIAAVLDWELASLGDPLADLGMLLAYWEPPAEAMLGNRVPTLAPGSIHKDDVIELYARETGWALDQLDLHYAMACWRSACLCLRTAVRFQSGVMLGDNDPRSFLTTCDVWTAMAREAIAPS